MATVWLSWLTLTGSALTLALYMLHGIPASDTRKNDIMSYKFRWVTEPAWRIPGASIRFVSMMNGDGDESDMTYRPTVPRRDLAQKCLDAAWPWYLAGGFVAACGVG